MRNTTCLPLCLLLACLTVGCQSPSVATEQTAEVSVPVRANSEVADARSAANALLGSLTDEQQELALRPIGDPLRQDWHYVPRQREGLKFGDMTAEQKALLHELMQTALSDAGYLRSIDIIWLEMLLYEQSNQNPVRSPNNYALVIFGDPTDPAEAWGWRLEGHHLSMNLTYTGQSIGVTPLFFGTNPAVVPEGPLAGTRVLSDVHDQAISLALSLSAEQREQMMIAEKPRDVITSPGNESSLEEPAGLSIDDMSQEQQDLLLRLMLAHLANFDDEHAGALYSRVVNLFGNGPILLGYHFSWAGPIDPDGAFYYRIHGPRFVIEYSCISPSHVHAVMHDLADPLQHDMLQRHYEEHDHE